MWLSRIGLGSLLAGLATAVITASVSDDALRCVMYLTGQHVVVPSSNLADEITHVILAFMRSDIFNVDDTPSEFPLFTTVDRVRSQFKAGTKITVAIGGWGDSTGFEEAAIDEASRKRWAKQVNAMVEATGADGVDIDWEYPGGNRDDYKVIPNSEREWEVEAYVLLLGELRAAIGLDKLLSIAVPGLERDLIAFTPATVPRIEREVDFINVMTYDLMNRRDTIVTHHSGVSVSRQSIERYIERGAPARKLNLGLGYYVKWFSTEDCDPARALDCPTQLLEDPVTGADLGKTGGFSWHDDTPDEVASSFARAQAEGTYFEDGSYGYLDTAEKRWWSFDTSRSVDRKFPDIVEPLELGGVFAWGLGEDAPNFVHLKATLDGVRTVRESREARRDEL